ncbi:MAG: acetoin utilization protein AcuC [Candidatus Hodarchaeales archaeon]|jgi:acetoin utilization protein AcuC
MKSAIFFSEQMKNYHLSDNHPMNSNRLITAWLLFNTLGIDSKIYEPTPAKQSDIESTHAAEYVEEVKRLAKNSYKNAFASSFEFGLGTGDCPIFPQMFEMSLLISGSVLQAADLILNGDITNAFILMGGLHHAQYERASGFCYFNDMSIVINYLRKQGYRVAYIDTDLHHGDGVQNLHYNDPDVLTISLHESGQFLFPGTGFSNEIGGPNAKGTSVNLPLIPYVYDKLYQDAFQQFIPTIIESFDPDFIVWQAGVDGHADDHLGHLQLTTNTYHMLGQTIRKLSEKYCEGNLLVAGGGGYSPLSVARSWYTEYAAINGINIPTETPKEWQDDFLKRFGKSDMFSVPKLMNDKETSGDLLNKKNAQLVDHGYEVYKTAFIEELEPYYTFKGD